jgi:uncharacterized protein (TIGR02284 family)
MPSPSAALQEVEATLECVIDSLIDGQKGLQKTGDELKDLTLKHYFLEESLTRAAFRGELEAVLHQEGVHDIKQEGTASASVRRAWSELKAMLGSSDHSLLETAEQAEDAAKKAYKDALRMELPFPVRLLLADQFVHVVLFHDFVKYARDNRG